MKGDPVLSSGHKQQKVVHRQGHFDPRTTIDPGPLEPPPASFMSMPAPPAREHLPHPVQHGFGGKGAEPKPSAQQEAADRHKRRAARAKGMPFTDY